MSPQKQALIEKIRTLPAAKVAQVEDFVDFLASRESSRVLRKAAKDASAPSFARIWNNPEDSAYDAL
jgi:hypothetical protein